MARPNMLDAISASACKNTNIQGIPMDTCQRGRARSVPSRGMDAAGNEDARAITATPPDAGCACAKPALRANPRR